MPPQPFYPELADDASKGNIEMLWGIKADTSSTLLAYINPYFKYNAFLVNPRFDPSDPLAQEYLAKMCHELSQIPLVHKIKDGKCVMEEFSKYLRTRLIRFPVPQGDFYNLFADYLAFSNANVMREGLVGFAKNNKCVMRYTGIAIRAEFKKSMGAWELLDTYDKWLRLQTKLGLLAPSSMGTPILVSDQFVSMATQVEAILSTALSIWIACVLVVLVVVLCTGSLQMACIILLNLLCIVAFVVGLISYNEMEFGGVEAIALTVLIGMSCDYCLHLSDTILTGRSKSRSKRVEAAISHLGPTIISAAGTSLLASVPTATFCTILILSNFGLIMCFSICSGVLFGIFFFCPMCILFGPRYAGRTWAETLTLSVAGSPLHFLSTISFLGFLGGSLLGPVRVIMFENVFVTAGLGFACVFSPIVVGVFVPPVGAFKEKCVRLKY